MAAALAAFGPGIARAAVGLPVRGAEHSTTAFLEHRGPPHLGARPRRTHRLAGTRPGRGLGVARDPPAARGGRPVLAWRSSVLEAVPAGLWLRPEAEPQGAEPRMRPASYARPLLIIGEPGRPLGGVWRGTASTRSWPPCPPRWAAAPTVAWPARATGMRRPWDGSCAAAARWNGWDGAAARGAHADAAPSGVRPGPAAVPSAPTGPVLSGSARPVASGPAGSVPSDPGGPWPPVLWGLRFRFGGARGFRPCGICALRPRRSRGLRSCGACAFRFGGARGLPTPGGPVASGPVGPALPGSGGARGLRFVGPCALRSGSPRVFGPWQFPGSSGMPATGPGPTAASGFGCPPCLPGPAAPPSPRPGVPVSMGSSIAGPHGGGRGRAASCARLSSRAGPAPGSVPPVAQERHQHQHRFRRPRQGP